MSIMTFWSKTRSPTFKWIVFHGSILTKYVDGRELVRYFVTKILKLSPPFRHQQTVNTHITLIFIFQYIKNLTVIVFETNPCCVSIFSTSCFKCFFDFLLFIFWIDYDQLPSVFQTHTVIFCFPPCVNAAFLTDITTKKDFEIVC